MELSTNRKTLETLPDEVKLKCVKNLGGMDIIRLSMVNELFHGLCEDELVWKAKVWTNLASTGAPKNCQSHIKNVINVFVNQVWFFGGKFNILYPPSLYLLNTNIVMNTIL